MDDKNFMELQESFRNNFNIKPTEAFKNVNMKPIMKQTQPIKKKKMIKINLSGK